MRRTIIKQKKTDETQILQTLPELIAAHYAADSPDADDLIGVEDEARSFARYITKRNLTTPLAIGLFGDWGAGKTFFMKKMQKFVGELEDQGRTDRKADRTSSWCENLIQIEFNAWHYIESNLWASLVEHIFSEMETWLTKEEKRSTIDKLYEIFESAQEVKREAEADLVEAKQARRDAVKELSGARGKYQIAIKEHRLLRSSDIWSAVTKIFATKQKKDAEFEKNIKEASQTLGIEELHKSAKRLHEVVEQAGDVAGRSRLLLSSLFSRQRNGWQYLGIVSMLASAPIVMGLAWTSLVSVEQAGAIVQNVGAGVAELSALITVIVGWGSVGLRSANKALSALEDANEELKEVIEKKTNEQREKLAIAETMVATSEERVTLAEQRLSQAVHAVDKANHQLKAETPRARLTRFLRRRLENADYAKHLGVVSMIRKDFDLLSRIMTGED